MVSRSPAHTVHIFMVLVLAVEYGPTGEADLTPTPKVVIDGYTLNSTLSSPATLPLGTTLILVCRLSGIPHGQQTTYTWTCPNKPCQQTGYAGRKINNNIIAINTTSTSDGGTYTCTVTAGGMNASQWFQLKVLTERTPLMHSYGRLIADQQVITELSEIAPPENSTSSTGRITCTQGVWYRWESLVFNISENTSDIVHQIKTRENSTLVVTDKWRQYTNHIISCTKGGTGGYMVNMFPSADGGVPPPQVKTVNISKDKVVLEVSFNTDGRPYSIGGYKRLDLGLPIQGEYWEQLGITNSAPHELKALVPGATYRITVWGVVEYVKRSSQPAVLTVKTKNSNPSPPRDLTITRVFQHGIELNWIPPRETNGDIQHYIIKYTTQDGTEQEITTTDNTNYHNLTELESEKRYEISIVAVNSFASEPSRPSLSYGHHSRFDPGPIIGGSVAGVVLLTIVVGVLSWCAATRKGKSGRGTQQKTTPTTHPYYRMPAEKSHNNTQANHYTSPQHDEQPESNISYHVIYSNDSEYEYDEVGDVREGVGYTASSNLTNGHRNTTGSHDMYSDEYEEVMRPNSSNKEALYTQPQKKRKVAITTQDSRDVSSTEPIETRPDQHRNKGDPEEERLSSHTPDSLFVQAEEVQPFPVGVSVPGDITPPVLLLLEDTTDNKH